MSVATFLSKIQFARMFGYSDSVAANNDSAITEETVRWGYRLFLDREPENDQVVQAAAAAMNSTESLRRHFMSSSEFAERNRDSAFCDHSNVIIKPLAIGPRLYIDLADHFVGLEILRDRYEVQETKFIEKYIKPGWTCLDLGANIGYFTIHLAYLVGSQGKVWAYEPRQTCLDLLNRSVLENKYSEIVITRQAVVGETNDPNACIVYGKSSRNFGAARLKADESKTDVDTEEYIQMIKIDDVEELSKIDFIKVDIEGAEPLAINGMKAKLKDGSPIILSEIHNPLLQTVSGSSGLKYIKQLEELGFSCHKLLTDGFISKERVSANEVDTSHPLSVIFAKEDTLEDILKK